MSDTLNAEALQTLLDKEAIRESVCRYARGVDRGDWDLVRSTYHPDAIDAHGDYKGNIDGLIDWLDQRFAGVDNSMHFLGNSLIDFSGSDLALVETYFVSRRIRPLTEAESKKLGSGDAMTREAWGRYVDRFERRDGEWRVAHRTVVIEALSSHEAFGGKRAAKVTWGQRNGNDRVYEVEAEIFGQR
jgi:hypothetical protein